MFLIDSIEFFLQSAVTLYIYRVGKTYPTRNFVYRSKSIKNSNCTRTPPRPVRPVGPTGQTGWSCQTVYKRLDRSDRLDTPVRPVCSGYCQFWSSTLSFFLSFFWQCLVPKFRPTLHNGYRYEGDRWIRVQVSLEHRISSGHYSLHSHKMQFSFFW